MKEKIDYWLNMFPQLTEDEVEIIDNIINLDDETKLAFKWARKIFEENNNDKFPSRAFCRKKYKEKDE